MMTSDLDIYRTANLLIDQHGDKAPIYAAMPTEIRIPLASSLSPEVTA